MSINALGVGDYFIEGETRLQGHDICAFWKIIRKPDGHDTMTLNYHH
jgi:hypothetical protein